MPSTISSVVPRLCCWGLFPRPVEAEAWGGQLTCSPRTSQQGQKPGGRRDPTRGSVPTAGAEPRAGKGQPFQPSTSMRWIRVTAQVSLFLLQNEVLAHKLRVLRYHAGHFRFALLEVIIKTLRLDFQRPLLFAIPGEKHNVYHMREFLFVSLLGRLAGCLPDCL